jgi:hypothetical protein
LSVTAPVVFGRRHVLPIAAEFLAEFAKIDLRLPDRSSCQSPGGASLCRRAVGPSRRQQSDGDTRRPGQARDLCQPGLFGAERQPSCPPGSARAFFRKPVEAGCRKSKMQCGAPREGHSLSAANRSAHPARNPQPDNIVRER